MQTNKSNKTIKILGLDPGTATTGWAVMEENNGVIKAVAYGHISTQKDRSEEERLCEICDDIKDIVKTHQPREAAIEKIFFFKNQKTVIQVAQARGALLLTLAKNNVKLSSYTPLQIKQALTSYGRAEKKQVQEMVKNILKMKNVPKPDDTADAIAIAICHIHSRKLKG